MKNVSLAAASLALLGVACGQPTAKDFEGDFKVEKAQSQLSFQDQNACPHMGDKLGIRSHEAAMVIRIGDCQLGAELNEGIAVVQKDSFCHLPVGDGLTVENFRLDDSTILLGEEGPTLNLNTKPVSDPQAKSRTQVYQLRY